MERPLSTAIQRVWTLVAAIALTAGASAAVGGVLIEAHRGYSQIAPENTIASIDAAVGSADLTEFDVRVTADGELVLMHDSSVDRTTNGSGAVSSMTLSQLKTLDAGSWFSPAFAGEQVPTMSEAISFAQSVGIEPLIERKAGNALTYHDELVGMGIATTDFRIISFDWSFLHSMDALNTNYNLGALGSGTLDQSVINSVMAQGADFLDWAHSGIDQTVVDLVHANGMELHVWTVNDSSRMQQLIDYGVDGITTDSPETLQQLVIQSTLTADLNMDNEINAADWLQYNAGRGVDFTGMSLAEARSMGDLDGDLDNDVRDFTIFKGLYSAGSALAVSDTLEVVPEPASAMLFFSGLVILARFHRLRNPAHRRSGLFT